MAGHDTIIEGVKSSASGLGTTITILIWILLFAIIGGVVFYYLIDFKRFSQKIIVYENIAGRGYVPTRKDRARIVKISDSGEELLYLKKHKVYRASYGQRVGKNLYVFAIGEDGYWYNITFSDLDKSRRELKINPIDKDLRYTHEGIRKNVIKNFQKTNWFKENIGMIFGVMSIILVLIFMWLLADKYFSIFNSAQNVHDAVVKGTTEILGEQRQLLSAIDNICSGGSGFVRT